MPTPKPPARVTLTGTDTIVVSLAQVPDLPNEVDWRILRNGQPEHRFSVSEVRAILAAVGGAAALTSAIKLLPTKTIV